jgi:hypothetical protein
MPKGQCKNIETCPNADPETGLSYCTHAEICADYEESED